MAFADHRENTVNHKLYFDLETGRGVIANPYYDDVTIKSESESFTLRSGIIRTWVTDMTSHNMVSIEI